VRPARCKKSAVFRGGSNTNTCDTDGSKSSPRARSDVLSSTRGAFFTSAASGGSAAPGKGRRNPARCLLEPCARPPWPVTTTFGTACSAKYAPISPALVRVLANMITRELARPASASSRQTALSFASTSALRLPDVYGANSTARCAGRRCSRGETSRVV
jgi:hypothetical protein